MANCSIRIKSPCCVPEKHGILNETMGGVRMDRRSFLRVTAGAAALRALIRPGFSAALPGQRLRLSVTWGMMSKLPIPEALGHLEKLGYDGYEMFNWRNADILQTFV